MTFKSWILTYTQKDSPRGDLARDIRRDLEFPHQLDTWRQLKAYLNNRHAMPAVMTTAYNAWAAYQKEQKK
ncbi:YozE family protein [Domibacillus tundrae]|uniref:YozE family protein n=1 Tax=Domibacillus tundrae TaxID=1587527 RepID=UPI000617FDC4|nr:YozE family protein [Domibacillus tundrae]